MSHILTQSVDDFVRRQIFLSDAEVLICFIWAHNTKRNVSFRVCVGSVDTDNAYYPAFPAG